MATSGLFAWTDHEELLAAIERHSFGLLITQNAAGPMVSHLPMLVERPAAAGQPPALVGHWSDANPQAREATGQSALAVFSGPHSYISPTWYGAQPAVPTWNYLAVHARGTLEVIPPGAKLTDLIERMVAQYEAIQEVPWQFDAALPWASGLLRRIVGFRLSISELSGTAKLGQNKPPEQRRRAIEMLRTQPSENSQAIAERMAGTLAESPRAGG